MKRRSFAKSASSSTRDAVRSSISRRNAGDEVARTALPSALRTRDLLRPTIERCTLNGLNVWVLSRISTDPSSKTPKSLGQETSSTRLNIAGSAAWLAKSRKETPSLKVRTLVVNSNASAYSASKAAVIALTKSLGKKTATTGIRVNCNTPAAIETPLFDQKTPQHIEFMLSKIPLGRLGEIEKATSLV